MISKETAKLSEENGELKKKLEALLNLDSQHLESKGVIKETIESFKCVLNNKLKTTKVIGLLMEQTLIEETKQYLNELNEKQDECKENLSHLVDSIEFFNDVVSFSFNSIAQC